MSLIKIRVVLAMIGKIGATLMVNGDR